MYFFFSPKTQQEEEDGEESRFFTHHLSTSEALKNIFVGRICIKIQRNKQRDFSIHPGEKR
jgi:hypothetical protein